MEYNSEKYIEFLNYHQELKKQKKSLRIQDPIKYSKLLEYAVQVSDYLHWSQRTEYLQLIENFLNFEINGQEFDNKFSKIVTEIEDKSRLLSKNHEELKRIKPDSKAFGFGTWISEIYLCCNEFYSDFDEEENQEQIPFTKTEQQLREAVKNLLPEIQKYF
jgi:hypothetical protein